MKVIELRNVSKKFTLRFQKSALVKELIPKMLSPSISKDFWALQNINLELEKGEVIGVIGDNGAGKTTLLSIIAKISFPTEGKVFTQGRVYPLLTLGAGFHRELSGEDNIYLNGLLLGLRMEEIKKRIEKIIEFSELGGFIKQPIYTYSSGMLLRLGFAIAVEVEFDILLLDEILAVGDIGFQKKCIDKIKEFIKKGKTIIISSQSLELIQELSQRVVLLDKGKIIKDGEPQEVISYYKELKDRRERLFSGGIELIRNISDDIDRVKSGWGKIFGNGKAEILNLEFIGKEKKKEDFKTGEPLTISVDAEIKEEIYNPHFGIAIFRDDYVYCHGPNTKFDGIKIKRLKPGKINFKLHYPKFILGKGNYKISVAIWDEEERDPYIYHCAYYDLRIKGGFKVDALLEIKHDWRIFEERHISNFDDKRDYLWGFDLVDKRLRPKKFFFTGEEVGVLVKLNSNRKEKLIKINIMNSLGILCFSSIKLIEKVGICKIFVRFPDLPLLSGDYIFEVVLTTDNGISHDKKRKKIVLLSDKLDHGIVYMRHFWKYEKV